MKALKMILAVLALAAGSAHAVGNDALSIHAQMIKVGQKVVLFSDSFTDADKDESALKGHELARKTTLAIDRQAADAAAIKEDCSAFGESIKAQVEMFMLAPEAGTSEIYKKSATNFVSLSEAYAVASCKELSQE